MKSLNKLDPFGDHKDQVKQEIDPNWANSIKSNKTFYKKETLDDYQYNPSGLHMPMYKTNKRMKFTNLNDSSYHGIVTAPSEDIRNIVNHSFEKTYLKEREQREQDLLAKIQIKKENIRSQETKASLMRSQAIKDKIDGMDKDNTLTKLKQSSSSKPSSIASENTKEIRK